MATYSKSLTVAAKSAYTLTINNIPTGSSVTPVNDIQTWLHCADIWSKTYTTISRVLADASTLQALIASTNAVDYMVRSTNWASSVCANATAMSYIGNNSYCANKLLANSTWRSSICNSTYFESVLNVKVPTMTSNTTPSGEAFGSVVSGTSAYSAFDNNNSTSAAFYRQKSNNNYVGYQFISSTMVCKVGIMISSANSGSVFAIEGSNDGSNYSALGTFTATSTYAESVVNNSTKYKYYRIKLNADGTGSTSQIQIYTLQFYGRA